VATRQIRMIQEAISRLPEDQRRLVILRCGKKLPVEKIAAQVGGKPDEVNQQLRSVLGDLHAVIEDGVRQG